MTHSAAVPMVDLHQQYLSLKANIDTAIADVLVNTHFIMGHNVHTFEQEAAAYLGCEHALSCANGTDALHLAMRALDLGPGDEVITPPFTFIATAEAIAYVGATPVFVDIDPHSFNIDPVQVQNAITDKTRAIVPVHLFGLPADMPALTAIANEYKLHIIEDCAQSFGARVNSKLTGTIGDIGTYSFFPSKNLGCYGDGGMLATNNPDLAEKIKVLRAHGSTKQYHHSVIGYNSRLDEIQAAILRQKLPHIDAYNESRARVAQRYCDNLKEAKIQLPQLQSAPEQGDATSVFHQFTFLTDNRDFVKQALANDQIASAVYYPIPLHKQVAITAHMQNSAQCPVAEATAERCLSLPIYPELDDVTIDRICNVVIAALATA